MTCLGSFKDVVRGYGAMSSLTRVDMYCTCAISNHTDHMHTYHEPVHLLVRLTVSRILLHHRQSLIIYSRVETGSLRQSK